MSWFWTEYLAVLFSTTNIKVTPTLTIPRFLPKNAFRLQLIPKVNLWHTKTLWSKKNTKANITRNRDIFIIIFNVTNQIIIIIIIIIITILMVADGGPPMGTTADSLATAWITTYKPKWIWPKKIKQLETLNYKHMCLWPPKIPSELEVTPRYNCLHCWHCWHCWLGVLCRHGLHCWHGFALLTWFTLLPLRTLLT